MTDVVWAAVAFGLILSAGVWTGGLVTVLVVRVVVDRQLGPDARVDFFRDFGRRFGVVAGSAFVVALGTGVALLVRHGWDAGATAALLVAALLAVTTAVGVRQARALTRLRARTLGSASDPAAPDAVEPVAARARRLRGVIAAETLLLVAIAAAITV
ncbi:MAG: hypothetical protein AB7G37_04845 [Solirubrobacteraceae bacterium]